MRNVSFSVKPRCVVALESLESRRLMAASLGVNLVVNGDAESDVGASNDALATEPSAWDAGPGLSNGFGIVKYGATGGFPTANSPGPASRGANFFAGGNGGPVNVSSSFTEQVIDISAFAADIDARRIVANASVFLGGFGSDGDTMTMGVATENSAGDGNAFLQLVGGTAAQRSNVTGLLPYNNSGTLPAGARSLVVSLDATRVSGVYNDGYADNVSVVLALAPGVDATKGFISGFVFNDANANGSKNGIEKNRAGVTVFVDADKDGKLDAGELKATTNSAGNYTIANVPTGNVTLRQIVPGTFRATTAVSRTVTVVGGLTTINQKFGVTQKAQIQGTVFVDTNGNGKREGGESGLAGVTVFLDFNDNGQLDEYELSTTTNGSGNYTFIVDYGKYQIRQLTPSGHQQSSPAGTGGRSLTLAKAQLSSGNNFGLKRV